MLNNSSDSFIIKQCPTMYGINQSDYIQQSETAIHEGLSIVQKAINEKKDLKKIFFDVLDHFATIRHDIAISHQTQHAEQFGRKRLDSAADVHYTVLSKPYDQFNSRIIAYFQELIKRGSIPIKGEQFKKNYRIEEEFQGRKCSFELELLTHEDLQKREWDKNLTNMSVYNQVVSKYKINPEINKIDQKNFPPTEKEKRLLDDYHQTWHQIKKEFSAFYVYNKMSFILEGIAYTFPSPKKIFISGVFDHLEGNSYYLKSIFVLGKVRIELDHKMYALTEYLTWTYQDYTSCPVDRLKHSTVVMIHQDRFLIDATLQEIAKIFEKVILMDKNENLETLKDQVAFIRYLFSHAMERERGSASMGEWFEKLIYQWHDYKCKHNAKTVGDMEAFVAPLWSTFRKQAYDSTIEISKKSLIV